ncbi:GNAT family N-acetyltransferase [Gemmobacter serpentinus]|uniref:GNAT family N-acetyltransferase n=1 Tax=Gemmobacter serpentinus TaxID=2652247 RepID=UPI00124F5CD5|nr:GNAT family N-acetyltransferase [Gemmobacter serpentinus]
MTVLQPGLPEALRSEAARLYWQAFGGKLGRVMGPDARALAYLERIIRPDHVIVAMHGGRLLGLAGFKSPQGAFADGSWSDLRAIYGWFGAAWRLALLMALMREVDNERFLIDGICVAEGARGRGIGRALIEALCAEARARGYAALRLEVIDSNPRARALYERIGFRVIKQERLGILRYAFGFDAAATMVLDLPKLQDP